MEITDYIALLQALIKRHSLSGKEAETADLIQSFFFDKNIPVDRLYNNVIARNKRFEPGKPTIILNSHHDTVDIGDGWTRDPLGAEIVDGAIFGRGANDAGGSLVSLIAAFCHYYDASLPYNLILIASGEEENFGARGVSSVLKMLDVTPQFSVIGEPTEMHMAIAEKGLIVIDATTKGKGGHAARDTGINALYLAVEDIDWIRNYRWEKESEVLGSTKTTVTQISAGNQHNVIPDKCNYVIDCRVNERYSLEEVLAILDEGTHARLIPRSLKWHPSGISKTHTVVQRGLKIGRSYFGSPTLSDQVHFACPTIKIGPGKSQRSHTPDEYIRISEIKEGIRIYIDLLDGITLEDL